MEHQVDVSGEKVGRTAPTRRRDTARGSDIDPGRGFEQLAVEMQARLPGTAAAIRGACRVGLAVRRSNSGID